MKTKCPKCEHEWELESDYVVENPTKLVCVPGRCWCGKTLKTCGIPDFSGDNSPGAVCTMYYECPEHGQDYTTCPEHGQVPGIAISGKARSGKSTLADMLVERLGGLWHIESLSEALIYELAAQLMVVNPLLNDILSAVDYISQNKDACRVELIELGQRRRAEDLDYWIKRLSCIPNAIIPNCRFRNEYHHFKDKGFYMVRVETLPEIREARGCPDLDDISETDLDSVELHEWDFLAFNNKSIDDLEYQADCIVHVLKGRM